MDSSVSETHGARQVTTRNGHLGCTCCHPLFVSNHFDDMETCALQPRNVHSTDGRRGVLAVTGIDYAALGRHVPFADDLAWNSAAAALESAPLTSRSGRPMVGHTVSEVLSGIKPNPLHSSKKCTSSSASQSTWVAR